MTIVALNASDACFSLTAKEKRKKTNSGIENRPAVDDNINDEIQPCTEKNYASGECWGGVSRRMTAVQQIRQSNRNVLLLDAGDQFQGTMWFVLFKEKPIAEVMNKLNYDAMVFGNHEFDEGDERALALVKAVNFPIVTSNMNTSSSVLENMVAKELLLEIDGQQVVIIGSLLPETAYLSNPENVNFHQEFDFFRGFVDNLESRGAKSVILLSHSGLERDRQLCQTVAGIDIIIGGHSNSFLYTGHPPSKEIPEGPYPEVYDNHGSPCVVVTAYAFGKYLGNLSVEFDQNGRLVFWEGNPILLDSSFADDEEMNRIIRVYEKELNEKSEMVIGSTNVVLDALATSCRSVECNVGNMMADHMVALFQPQSYQELPEDSWTQGSLAIINGGTFRNFYKGEPGVVTLGNAYAICPFQSEIVMIRIKGQHIQEAFEHAVQGYAPDNGKFLQVSGVKVVYDLSKPKYQRVVSLQLLCQQCKMPKYEPVQLDREYNVITKNYLYEGGDGFSMLMNGLLVKKSGVVESLAIIDYFKTNVPVKQGIEGRIVFMDSGNYRDMCGSLSKAFLNHFSHGRILV